MYRRILLAYDGSREGRAALREGALLAHRLDAAVFLLSVVAESPGVRLGEAAYAGGVAHASNTYKDLFEEAMTKLRAKGMRPEGRIVIGEPTQAIAAYAREVEADLVVVGHRRQSMLERWWSGSTGAYLTDQLDCSVLIARQSVTDARFAAEFEGEVQSD
ncbi:MAG: UspA domain protein [Caulobacteraceae bacterium]|nr:UspA domain protein [Caulobacteraceae bacterium]